MNVASGVSQDLGAVGGARAAAIVPADGYYEWYAGEGPKAPKQPFYITAAGDGDARDVLALAGLYEFWRPSRDEPWLLTFTILTTSAEGADGLLHDRAPLLVRPEVRDTWLAPIARPAGELLDLLVPATPGRLEAWPASTQHPGEQRAPQRSGARGAAAGRVRRGCCVGPRNRARVGTVVMRVRRPTCSRALSAPPPAPRPCPSTSSPQATVGPRE